MNLARKISHLKHLDSIQPDKKWEKTTKYDLLEEISSQNRLMQAYKLSTAQQIDLFMMRAANRLAPSMKKVLATFLIFMMFFGVNIAAQASVPGEPLWPVKRSIEEAEISLTFSTVKKTEVHIKHVNERLAEIDKILESPADVSVPETKVKTQKAIKTAVNHLEKDVTSVDASLKIVKEEKEALEIVELVKKVTDATKEVDSQLKEKKKEVVAVVNDEEVTDAIDEAKVANKKVKKSAVSVALEIHEELTKAAEDQKATAVENNNVNSPVALTVPSTTDSIEDSVETDLDTTTPDMIKVVDPAEGVEDVNKKEIETITNIVKEIVASEIDEVSVEVKDVKQKVEVVADEELQKIKQESLQDSNIDPKKKVEAAEVDEIDTIKKESSEATEVVLQEAKVLLDSGMLKDAFAKVSEVQAKYEKAEATLEKIEKVKNDTAVPPQDTSKPVSSADNTQAMAEIISPQVPIKQDEVKASTVELKE